MCGIAGYLGPRVLDQARIEECLKKMRRRGPDHQGIYQGVTPSGRQVTLLHTRLSIIDVDPRAHQPMRLGTQVLVTNGELYNYLELRNTLDTTLRTESDTEVLLHLLREKGWRGLENCEGMWAFALYDEANGSLTLSRDRFGEKPLYLLRHADGVYFASEVQFLAALCPERLRINVEHLKRLMVNGYKALYKEPRTFFHGVEELPRASVLEFDGSGKETLSCYWAPGYAPDHTMSYDDAVEGTKAALIEAVRIRLRSDVPLAFSLSGGVDSNALVGIAHNVLGFDVHGFTIANTDARYAETELVNHSVAELGVRHTSIPVDTSDFLVTLRELVRYRAAPVYTITYLAHWRLMQCIAQHGYKISIGGTGADELFSGYYDHHNAYLYEVRNDNTRFAQALAEWKEFIAPIVRNPHLQDPHLFLKNPCHRDHVFLNADKFSACTQDGFSEPFAETRYTDGLLRNRMLNELFHEAVPAILHEDDLNAMYFSLENRSPYLDRKLFEHCQRIPTRHLVQAGRAKAVLRDAVRGISPQRILDERRKVGFNAPLTGYLDLEDPEIRSWLLDDGPIFDLVIRDKIEALISSSEVLPNSVSKFLFYFVSSKAFMEEFA